MLTSELTDDINLGIRAHYVTGWFDLDTALDRIQFGGLTVLNRRVAAQILRQPITTEQVKARTGRDVTDEQIAGRLAEVTA